MDGFWPVFYFVIVLKIPVLFSLWLVWWALKQADSDSEGSPGDGGGPRRPRPSPVRPRSPKMAPLSVRRRSPHREPRPALRDRHRAADHQGGRPGQPGITEKSLPR